MHKSLRIKNGNILLSTGEIARTDVLISKGKIEGCGERLNADETIDAGDYYVLPGLMDIHTHGLGEVSTDRGRLEDYAAIEASRV